MNRFVQPFRGPLYRAAAACTRLLPAGEKRRYRLAVLKLDGLGDAMLAVGAIRRLVREFREAETLLMVSPRAEPLLRPEFPRSTFLVLPTFCHRYWPDFLSFLWTHGATLRSLTIESLVCLRHQPSDYLHAVARLIDPQHCYAAQSQEPWSPVALGFPNATLVPYPLNDGLAVCELEAHRRVVAAAIGRDVAMDEVMPALTSILPTTGHALLVCPAAGNEIRQYPPRLLAEALRLFLTQQGLPIHFCLPPGTDPQPWQQALAEAAVPCHGWHYPATIQALLLLLADARLVLAPESGPAHLVTALDKAGVFLLGGGHIGLFAPWSKSHRQIWLQHPLDCYHCRWNCIHPEAYCITHITPAAVAEGLLQAFKAG